MTAVILANGLLACAAEFVFSDLFSPCAKIFDTPKSIVAIIIVIFFIIPFFFQCLLYLFYFFWLLVLFSYSIVATFSIRIVADCVALFCQVLRKLKRATTLEYTTVSAIIFIHLLGAAIILSFLISFLLIYLLKSLQL